MWKYLNSRKSSTFTNETRLREYLRIKLKSLSSFEIGVTIKLSSE